MNEILNLKTQLKTPFIFSQSSLQDYEDCARRFQLRYIEELKWPAIETAPVLENEHRQVEGQQFHRMIQQYFLGLPAKKIARMANSENLIRWWENFAKSFNTMADYKLFPELSLSAPIGKHRIQAKYDLVAIRARKAIIFDWKTYHKRPQNSSMLKRWQTRVYQATLALASTHINRGQLLPPENIEMVYWYSDFPSEPLKFSYDTLGHEQALKELSKLLAEITAKQSYPLTRDEKKCSFCSYRSFCERGITAGDDQDIENAPTSVETNLEQIQEIEL